MPRFLRKSIGLLLAAILPAMIIPPQPQAGNAPAGNPPLRVEISTCKKSHTLLSVITYAVTVTNESGAVIRNVSAEVLFGKDITPLEKNSRLTAGKGSLAPGESLRFSCNAQLNTLRKLDIFLTPFQWIRNLFTGPELQVTENGFGDGRKYTQASARAGLISFFDAAYDTAGTVRVWYGYPSTDDFSGVLSNNFFEGYEDQDIDIDGDAAYYLFLSRARNLCAGMRADGAGLKVSTIEHNVAWTFGLEAAGDGNFVIRSLASGLVAAGTDAENAALRLEEYTGQSHQLWYKQAGRDGQFYIINANSGKAIDIGGGDALVQRTPGPGASQAWELCPIDVRELAGPAVPNLDGRANWAKNAIRYPEEGKPVPAGPIYIQWYQDASIGDVEYYEIAFDGGEPVAVLPTGALIMGYRWYSTEIAYHTVRVTAVLKNSETVVGDVKSFPVSKKGMGWGTLHRIEDMNLAWYYNWYTTPCASLPRALQFEPQVWGNTPDLGLGGLWEKGFRSVMAFNEPDSAAQANMTAGEAIGLWPQFVEETGLRLGSPVTAAPASTSAWFSEFMSAAGGDVDFLVLHIYNSKASVSEVLDIVDRAWQKYKKPIWIKELAVASFGSNSPWAAGKGNPAAVAAFMEALLGELDKRTYVERYAWYPFGADDPYGGASALFDYGTGELTMLGEVYKRLGLPK
ncbi:MAG: glycosyl hydrolase [Oscillospiraceae bacterium]|nr:glycosyl hydrolase [Oscillospiraceae bacterium]